MATSTPTKGRARSRNYTAATAGTTESAAVRAAKEAGTFCSYEDVKRACHAWLMKRDPLYRRNFELWHSDRSASRPFVGF